MKLYRILFLLLAMGAAVLASCGGGGGSGGDPNGGVTAIGYFKDSNVSGLSFRSGAISGVTGKDGSFRYEKGGSVSFSVGGITIGETKGKSVVTPLDLVSGSGFGTRQVGGQ